MELMIQTADIGTPQGSVSAQLQQSDQEYIDYGWEHGMILEEASRSFLSPQLGQTGGTSHLPYSMLNAHYPTTLLLDSKKRYFKAITDLLNSVLNSPSGQEEESEQDPVEEKLNRIGGFTSGWHFGEGVPLRPDTLRQTRQLYQFGKVLSLDADVFPHEDGDLSIMFKSGNQYLEIWCMPGRKFSFTLEEGTDHPFILLEENEEATFSNVIKELLTFARSESLWDYCDSFTLTNTATVSADLPLIVFATPRTDPMEPLWQRTNAELACSTLIAYVNALQINTSANTLWKNMEKPMLSVDLSISGFSPIYPTT